MKRMPLMLAGALALASAASLHAQSTEPQPAPVPPPPGMDEPGVKPAEPATVAAPAKPAPRDARGQPAPTVNVRTQDNGDTVEEYRAGGRIYMIRIIPKHGIPQTFMDTRGDGKLTPDPKQGPVSPVYYTIYQWGKPSKTVEQQESGG